MPRAAAASARIVISASLISAPVGLHGELMMMAFVRAVMASMKGCAVIAKPSSACVRTTTGVASANLTCSVSVGHPGACVITSSPSPKMARAGLQRACLPPADTMVSASVHSMP